MVVGSPGCYSYIHYVLYVSTRKAMAESIRKLSPRPKRRTQEQRRDAMRTRLMSATLECLARDGYAGTTVSSIVRRAGVSRGAHVHHFPTKNALIVEAAGYLMRRAYRILGELLLSIAEEDDRLGALVETAWREIFDTRMYEAYVELMVASQRDAELAKALRKLSAWTENTLHAAVTHYFEPRDARSESPHDLFLLTTLALGNLALARNFMAKPAEAKRYVEVWLRLMASQMKARKGVKVPPPRPADWA